MEFQVFKEGKNVNDFTLCGAYLFGTDGVAIRKAKISFKNGFVKCKKPNKEAVALALLWPVDGFGKVLLPTTCLPEREQPYNLNVEMARAKLMQIINKREDWSVFGYDAELEALSKEIQALFVQAVQNIKEPSLASKLADKSLKKAIIFSEELATRHAQLLFDVRGKTHGFGRGCLGCEIDATQIDKPEYISKLLELFGFATIPINWSEIEVRKGSYDFSVVDACVSTLSRKKLAIGAGPLLCFSKEYMPKWLLSGKANFETIREAAYRFISKIVSRYASYINTWRVVSGLNVFNCFGFSFEQILEMTRAANMAVKAANDKALKIIEITNPWGEYHADATNTIPPLVYVDMIVQSGINFDILGLQMQFGENQDGMHIRDMMHVSAVLDYFGAVAKPVYITSAAVPSCCDESQIAGVWHKQWDQLQQAKWIEQFYKIAFSKAFIHNVTYSNIVDAKNSTIMNSGLLNEQFVPKESFKKMMGLHKFIFNRQINPKTS